MRPLSYYRYFLGSVILPVIADAATVALEPRYIKAAGLPILPLKFLLAVEITVSPSAGMPLCVPTQGPHARGNYCCAGFNERINITCL